MGIAGGEGRHEIPPLAHVNGLAHEAGRALAVAQRMVSYTDAHVVMNLKNMPSTGRTFKAGPPSQTIRSGMWLFV